MELSLSQSFTKKIPSDKKSLRHQAVILAAGKGTRIWPLTSTKPKPLLKVLDKTILEHNLDQLTSLVEEVILVIGHNGQEIKHLIGNYYQGLKISYAWQRPALGTGDALKRCQPLLKDRFLVLNGDDFYFREDIAKCFKKSPSILVKEVEDPKGFAVILREDSLVKDIIEKPKKFYSNLASIGAYFLDDSIFKTKLRKSSRGEYEITDFIKGLARQKRLFFHTAQQWFPISYPWHLLEVNEFLLKNKERKIGGKVEKNCQIIGPVVVQRGTRIETGTYIEGPVFVGQDCQIGPGCRIKKFTSIGDNCQIGQGAEVENSIIGRSSLVAPLSYIGDSIIGENCSLGVGTITVNAAPDENRVISRVKGKKVDTKREKFGSVLGDNTKTGAGVFLMPGVLVGSNSDIAPDSLIFENIEDNTVFGG